MKDMKDFIFKSFLVAFLMIFLSNAMDPVFDTAQRREIVLELDGGEVYASDHHLFKTRNCENNRFCKTLAEAIFFEGRGESIDGQYAIAYTVINRRDAGRWPDDVVSVVNQRINGTCQFSYVCQFSRESLSNKIRSERESWTTALTVAYDVYYYETYDNTGGADHYYNPDKVSRTPRFAQVYTSVADIGNHKFFRSH